MPYDLSSDQALFREAVQAYLGRTYGQDVRHEIVHSDAGLSADVWRGLATEIGVLGLGFDEGHGGLGGGAIDQIPVMEAFGQALLVEPYLETVILAGELLKRSSQPVARNLIDGIIAGEVRLALARTEPESRFNPDHIATKAERMDGGGFRLTGRKTMVVAAPWADYLLVVASLSGLPEDVAGHAVFVIPAGAAGLAMAQYPTIDGRRAADIELSGVVVAADACILEGQGAIDAIDAAHDAAAAGVCAEAVGIMRRLLGETHVYLQERKQFGAPLASFQALQHRMADMLIALELSSAHAYRAASAVMGSSVPDRRSAVSAAKAFVGRAAHRMGQEAIQMHGGMGMTDELIIGHLFRRAIAIEAQFGSTDHHVRRFQALRRDVAADGSLH
ncbi:MAG: acyl-CoA dehydrogenase [Brevundimonas sp.]|uniref:acyl-CoA dehydrogenase family protein n=1 Tax=Brevundimonas sp. TaxID=1871086 RepID=UPI0027328BBF|nr:acyl-CoA dehydrogenase [Brevundimonas sp.]MDP3403487.1 acyl-CoA dehydrogenase [Brevundimonas sp.]